MDKKVGNLESGEKHLFDEIHKLRDSLNVYTKQAYNRFNPMNENLIDWKEKGRAVSGHDNNTIYESSTIIGDVKMGNNCWIGPFTILDGGGGLIIGDFVTVAASAMIFTHDTYKYTLSGGTVPYEYKSVVIGSNCFIGTQATILKGVNIGHHSMISANSLITCDIPPYSIAAGSPAKIIGRVVVSDDDIELVYDKINERCD